MVSGWLQAGQGRQVRSAAKPAVSAQKQIIAFSASTEQSGAPGTSMGRGRGRGRPVSSTPSSTRPGLAQEQGKDTPQAVEQSGAAKASRGRRQGRLAEPPLKFRVPPIDIGTTVGAAMQRTLKEKKEVLSGLQEDGRKTLRAQIKDSQKTLSVQIKNSR